MKKPASQKCVKNCWECRMEKFSFKNYFSGEVKSWGIISNRQNKIIKQFSLDMFGTWNGGSGELQENFIYSDGTSQNHVWHVIEKGSGQYEARANDIIGRGQGIENKNSCYWQYVMAVPIVTVIGKFTFNLTFDDRMWLMNEKIVINKSIIKKFGIRVGELTAVMQKQ